MQQVDDVNTPTLETGVPRQWWGYLLKGVLLCIAASVVVLWWNADTESWDRLTSVEPSELALLLGMVLTAWICNGFRTWIMARALGHPIRMARALGITLSMEFAIAATPGGVAGIPTRVLLQRRAGIPVHASMSMVASDISADLIFFIALAPVGITALLGMSPVRRLLEGLPWPWIGVVAGIICTALLVLLVLVKLTNKELWFRILPSHWTSDEHAHRCPNRWFRSAGQELRKMNHSLKFILGHRRGHYFLAFLAATIQWCCRYGILPVILVALDRPIDAIALFYLQGFLFLLGLFVVAPGGGGSLEILSTLILRPLVGSSTTAVAVVLWRVLTYYLYLLGGGLALFLILWKGKKKSLPADPGKEEQNATDPMIAHIKTQRNS